MKITPVHIRTFQETVFRFYTKQSRSLPWRDARDPYAILVSEIMLQQTQAERVVPFYETFLKKFPTLQTLARASVGEVLRLWQGLGYNRRALNLKRSAEMIVNEYGGVFPETVEAIDTLPGVGPYTAGAVAAFAFGNSSAFIETNIRTVYLHFFFRDKLNVSDEDILTVIRQTLPDAQHSNILKNVGMLGRKKVVREWYNALMDYGAMLKKKEGNENVRSAGYKKQSKFKGSQRELRGEILRKASHGIVYASTFATREQKGLSVSQTLSDLESEGFLRKKGTGFVYAS